MQRQHPPRLHQFDIFQQIVIARVIAQRKRRVHLVTVHRPRRHGPPGQHGHPPLRDPLDHARAPHAGRTNQHMTGEVRSLVFRELRNTRHQLAVNLRQLGHRPVQHRRQTRRCHRAKNFLRLAQRITEQHRHLAILQRLAAKLDQVGEHPFRRRKNELRFAERRFHDQRVRRPPGDPLARQSRSQLEIPRVEQRPVAGLQMQLRRPVHMPRRQQSEPRPAQFPRLPEFEHMLMRRGPDPRPHQPRRRRREHRLPMFTRMVAVRVRNKSQPPRHRRIQPQIQ